VFTFTTFALVEAFGLGPSVVKRRKSVASVFNIIDRQSKMETDDVGLKPPHILGRIEFRDVDFR
jgi:ATP-binding cassette subfamily B (MDR/TAP) protein 1